MSIIQLLRSISIPDFIPIVFQHESRVTLSVVTLHLENVQHVKSVRLDRRCAVV